MAATRDSIRERLNLIFQDIFDDESIHIHDGTTSSDIEEWDSLMHITLVIAIEKQFDVTLNASEVGNLANVGAMIDILMQRSTIC